MTQSIRKSKRKTQDINNNSSYTTSQTHSASTAIYFHKLDNVVLLDEELYGTASKLYNILLGLSNINTNRVVVYMSELAKKLQRSISTTQRHLKTLIKMGLVERVFRQSPINPKMNLANLFIIHGRDAKRYENSGVQCPTQITKIGPPPPKNATQKKREDYIKNKETINRGAANTPKAYVLENVPEVLRTTVEFLLLKTGRKEIRKSEVEILRELFKNHTPVRIQKEIDTAIERFIRLGKNLRDLTFNYIGKALKHQRSLKAKPKPVVKAKAKTAEHTPQPPELNMPIEEAEKVIAEYMPTEKQGETIPAALSELHEKIRAVPNISFEDYIHLKFPEATEEELRTDYRMKMHDSYEDFPEKRELEQAFAIDYGCANCTSPENCQLPKGCKKGGSRPLAKVSELRGKKFLGVAYGGSIKCKHGKRQQNSPEFEQRLEKSGLSATQAQQTFEKHKHKNAAPEVAIAKAKAILAAKNKRSLILAGKPGAGKTHLAAAIAIHAMKNGRQAIFRTVPEMLDELRQRARDYNDFYLWMRKFKDVPCLVLDDLGKEKTTQAGLDYLYQIIDYRYRNGMQTILTTNALDMDGLKNQWNADTIEPLISRILENGDWVTLRNVENYRVKRE